MPPIEASERLMELVFEARDEAVLLLREGKEVIPFVMRFTKTGYVLQRFTAPNTQTVIERARAQLRENDPDTLAYTLVYDAFITIDGQDHDALLLEAGERSQESGLRFAQRYQPRTATIPFGLLGDLALLGASDHYLRDE